MYFVTPLPVWGRRRYETAEPAGVEGKRGFVASYPLFSRHVSAVCPCVLPGLLILSPAWRPSPRAGYWGRRHGHGLRTSDPLCGWMLGRQNQQLGKKPLFCCSFQRHPRSLLRAVASHGCGGGAPEHGGGRGVLRSRKGLASAG